MATLMWIRTEDNPYIVPYGGAMLPGTSLCLRPLKFEGVDVSVRPMYPRYLIAKGNVIEGIEAKW